MPEIDKRANKFKKLSLEDSELRYRRLFETAQDGILILEADTGAIADVNPFLIHMLGYSRDEFINKKLWQMGAFQDIEASQEAFEALQKNEFIRYEDLPLRSKQGALIEVEFVSNVYMVGRQKVIQCNIRDITARKRAEEALQKSEMIFRGLVEHLPSVVYMSTIDETNSMIFVSPQIKTLLGYTPEEWLAEPTLWAKSLYAEDRQNVLMQITALTPGSPPTDIEYRIMAKDARLVWVREQVKILTSQVGGHQFRQGIMSDITERKAVEKRIQRQLEHLTALSAIDRVISANFDLKLSLSEILRHVTIELDVDAADILILNTNTQMLEFGAERGFRDKAIRKTCVRLGESYAGRVALDRQLIQIYNLRAEPENLFLNSILKGDNFFCYFAVPLIVKGLVVGVLEVFHRSTLDPDAEWFDFLVALSGQAAIAIENSTLFESLQRSNAELSLAYNATIEGWSHALDLRDRETEGHTQRVSEMTVKFARSLGMNEAELVQIRWGALLHDIGKLGVPDGILHKTSPLTQKEWVVMKMHPVFAYDMLSHIHYLRLATDIPYAHHEKWDGTGYPHGLKGTQIPQVARIFAVVDVWDALSSDRPYRSAWDVEKISEHIRSLSGTHFDPQIVEVFLRVYKLE